MKKFTHYTGIVFFVYTVSLLYACNLPRTASKSLLPVPDAYYSFEDSARTENVSWQSLFEDPVLKSLIDTAVKNNLDLQNTLEYIAISRANLLFNRGLGLPSLDGFVSGAADKFGRYTMTGVGNFDTNLSPNITEDQKVGTRPTQEYFLGLKSSWEIDMWGKLRSRKKAAAARLLATEQGRQWAVTQLVTQVATLYFELLATDSKQEIIRRNIVLQEHSLEVVKAMKEGGRATSLAVQQFTAQLLQTRSLEQETRLHIMRLENELNTLQGRFPQPVSRGDSINRQFIPQTIAAGIPADLLRKRPDILEAELQLEATKADTDAARKAFFPSLTLTPYLAFNAFKLPLLFANGSLVYGLLGGVTQPIFNRYQLKADFAVANAEQNIAFNTYQKTVLQGYQEVLTNLQGIAQYKKVVALNDEEVQTLAEAVSTAHDLYLGGYASYLEVITAQKGVLDAELNKTMSQRLLLQSIVDTYRALGGGW